jgi:Uma2 family endonuclease
LEREEANMQPVTTRATLADLARTEGKAELIGGRIVHLMPTGRRRSRIAFRIARSLDDHAAASGIGEAYVEGAGFAVPELPSGRESFCPDAAFYDGQFSPNDMDFIEGPPTFAVEVRSKSDTGPAAEAELAAKRDDYFQAGTLVVWDVDPVAETITRYRVNDPSPAVFRRGDVADAEPAVPGWRMPVDEVFA